MSLRKKGLFVALESNEEVNGISLEALALEAEESVNETEEVADDVVSDTNDVEEAAEDSETLERIKDTMENSVEEGEGLSEDAAEIAEVAIEAIYERLGLEKTPMPAMESFGSSSSRVTATRIAMEGIADTIKKIWEGIKNFFIKIYEKIKGFFTNFEKSVEKLDAYITSLIQKSNDLSADYKPAEKELKNKSLAKKFNIGGKANLKNAETILDNSTVAYESIEKVTSNSDKVIESLKEIFSSKEAFKNENGEKEKVDSIVNKFIEDIKSSLPSSEVKEDKKTSSVKITVGPIVGGKKVIYDIEKKKNGLKISMVMEDQNKEAGDSITALNLSQIENILSTASTKLSIIKKGQKVVDKAQTVNEGAVDVANSVINFVDKVGEDLTPEVKTMISGTKETITSINNAVSRTLTAIPTTALDSVRAAANYADASMKNLETKK